MVLVFLCPLPAEDETFFLSYQGGLVFFTLIFQLPVHPLDVFIIIFF